MWSNVRLAQCQVYSQYVKDSLGLQSKRVFHVFTCSKRIHGLKPQLSICILMEQNHCHLPQYFEDLNVCEGIL
jgi:hypothetical protein